MTEEKALTPVSPYAIMPVMDIRNAVERRNAVIQFTRTIMLEGTHFGKVPGTAKNTLLKPGAEMLTTFFGLSPRFVIEEKTLDWTGAAHAGEAFFYFQYRCQLWRGDILAGEGIGSCNSWEKKYRYRSAGGTCPNCTATAIARSSYPPRGAPEGTPNGWYCKECKANFAHDDPRVASQGAGQVANPNPADLVNTIDKMAQKRALVAATLIAVNASEFFTQDLEDLEDWSEGAIPGELVTKPAQSPQSPKPAQQPPARPANGGTRPVPQRQPEQLEGDPVDYNQFWRFEAFRAIGYDSIKHVQNAAKLIWPDRKAEDIPFPEFWQGLREYHDAKQADAKPAEAVEVPA